MIGATLITKLGLKTAVKPKGNSDPMALILCVILGGCIAGWIALLWLLVARAWA